MADPTPEEQSRAVNIVKAVQERQAKLDARSGSAATRQERVEQTYGVDARKTRDLIRQGRFTSLPVLARCLQPFITDQGERIKLEEALDRFMIATGEYRRTEELPSAVIDWLGPPNGQLALPPGAPDHKRHLVEAWHALLKQVNELSRVGVIKPPRLMMSPDQTAIELLVDLDEDNPQVAPAKWD